MGRLKRACSYDAARRAPCANADQWDAEARLLCAYSSNTRRCRLRDARRDEAPPDALRVAIQEPGAARPVPYDFPVRLQRHLRLAELSLPARYPRPGIAPPDGVLAYVKYGIGSHLPWVKDIMRATGGPPRRVLLIKEFVALNKTVAGLAPLSPAEARAFRGLAVRLVCHLARALNRLGDVTPSVWVVLQAEGRLVSDETFRAALARAKADRAPASRARLARDTASLYRGLVADYRDLWFAPPVVPPVETDHNALAEQHTFLKYEVDLVRFYHRAFGLRPIGIHYDPDFHHQTAVFMAAPIAVLINRCEIKHSGFY